MSIKQTLVFFQRNSSILSKKMEPHCKISRKTFKSLDKSLDTHRIKILSFIYHKYISKTGITYDAFIKDYK